MLNTQALLSGLPLRSPDVYVWASDANYQTLINQALREYLKQQQQPLEELLRRVVCKELQSAAQ